MKAEKVLLQQAVDAVQLWRRVLTDAKLAHMVGSVDDPVKLAKDWVTSPHFCNNPKCDRRPS